MADFCKACSIEHFGKDYGDHAKISTPEDTAANRFAGVICEGCGFIYVDHEGNCVSPDCSLAGKEGHGVRSRTEPSEPMN